MKFLKSGLCVALLATVVGCGSSQAPVVGLGNNYPYTNPNPTSSPPPGTQTGFGTYSLPNGGTLQVFPVLSGYAYASSNRTFFTTPMVEAMDQVQVYANGAQVYAQGLLGGTNAIWVNSMSFSVSGSSIGQGLMGKFNVTQSGVLSISFGATGLSNLFGNMAQYTVAFPWSGGVNINRCHDSSGTKIVCPI